METKDWLGLILVGAIAVTPIVVVSERMYSERSLSARAIQFLAVAMLIPTILVLSLQKLLEPTSIGTIIGALTGYLLSGIGEYRPDNKKKKGEGDDEPKTARE